MSVCASVCVRVHYMSPVAYLPQILSHFSALWTPTKKLVPTYRMAAPHQTSQKKDTFSTSFPQWKFDRLAAKNAFWNAQGKLREELLQSIKRQLKSKEFIWIYCIHKDIIWAHSAFKSSKRNTYIVNLMTPDPPTTEPQLLPALLRYFLPQHLANTNKQTHSHRC